MPPTTRGGVTRLTKDSSSSRQTSKRSCDFLARDMCRIGTGPPSDCGRGEQIESTVVRSSD